MTETDLAQPEPMLAPSPLQIRVPVEEVLTSLRDARSNRAVDQLVGEWVAIGAIDDQTKEAIRQRRKEIQRLLVKTRKVAWIWANVYGYGDDDLFPAPLYHPEAAYLAVVQAGVILVLDSERRRVACFVSDDGCIWKWYTIRRNAPLNNKSICTCRIKMFPRTET